MADAPDIDPQETQEWLEAIESVLREEGGERAHFLIESLIDKARRSGVHLPHKTTTAYVNTIHVNDEDAMPGEPGANKGAEAAETAVEMANALRAIEKGG